MAASRQPAFGKSRHTAVGSKAGLLAIKQASDYCQQAGNQPLAKSSELAVGSKAGKGLKHASEYWQQAGKWLSGIKHTNSCATKQAKDC